MRRHINKKRYAYVKRAMDVVIASAVLLVAFVPVLLVLLAVYIDDPGPVLFSQYRTGRYGEPFKLYKIRTLKLDAPKYAPTRELKNKPYLTRVGKILRRLSIDELPQLINVIRGDMSLVGPRPLIAKEHEVHTLRMARGIYEIRPGITGLAQINGRDELNAEEKVWMDELYLENFSFLMDIRILFGTLPIVFKEEQIRIKH